MSATYAKTVEQYCPFEVTLQGKCDGNPFTDYSLRGTFTGAQESVTVDGFYDGDGCYKVRFMPSHVGDYTFKIEGSAVDSAEGSFAVEPAQAGNHGMVRVKDQFHFAYDDGTPYQPFGTTCYVWTMQPEELQRQTLETLQDSCFNKIRFCVFPKHYIHNFIDPISFPYEGTPCDRSWLNEENFEYYGELPGNHFDKTRFNVEHFRHLEKRIQNLMDLGIEADLIVMHPYDCWGFSSMTREQDDLYWNYVVARFAAYRNVWWSLANEYDFLREKTDEDWRHYAQILVEKDPYLHLRSVHNGTRIYDYTEAWATHCGIQTSEVGRIKEWREKFGKPVVIDEMCYEGNIDLGWGNISAEEMSNRCWQVAIGGGYIGHGETYVHPRDILWWSHGGRLHGRSEARIAFLRRILEEVPGRQLRPADFGWDAIAACPQSAQDEHEYMLVYFGIKCPGYRNIKLDDEHTYQVEVIDTWDMTVTDMGCHKGWFKVPMPGKPYMALRITRKD